MARYVRGKDSKIHSACEGGIKLDLFDACDMFQTILARQVHALVKHTVSEG